MPTLQASKVAVIVQREYVSRIKTKGFWIGTVILPLFMLAMTVVPSLLLAKSKANLRLAVVDETGQVGKALLDKLREADKPAPEEATEEAKRALRGERRSPPLKAEFTAQLEPPGADPTAQRKALDQKVLAGDLDAWVWIDEAGLAKNKVEYHGQNVSNFVTQERLTRAISAVVRDSRLRAAGYDAEKVAELAKPIDLATLRVTAEGARAEMGMAGFFFAYFLFFLLYVVLMIYGQQVMTGVLEEKTSRVVEVVVSTVKPMEMMLGKLLGICLVGLTQLAIWLGTAAVITAPGIVATLVTLPEGIPSVTPGIIFNFLAFFLLGFFLYATFFAAIGSAFNDLREAQQAATGATFFLVGPIFIMFLIMNDPDSPIAILTSLFPPFTPLLMMLRIVVKTPPVWQIALGYALTAAAAVGMVWVCAKIYRTGILMYGKKPTFKELWQWVRYA